MTPHEYLELVRKNQPLVHHITNWVTIGDCATVTRMFGALPVMAHSERESGDMAAISSALVLNIGTLTQQLVESMIIAGKSANNKGIPVVFDAVGVGATPFRNEAAAAIMSALDIAVVKGNASEIACLGGVNARTRGVEATQVSADLITVSREVANRYDATVAITGAEDIVANADTVRIVRNGHKLMGAVVGTGCMAASVIGAFAAVAGGNTGESTAAALACYGVAAEIAARRAEGPAQFKQLLFDAVFNLSAEQVKSMSRIELL